MSDAILKGWSTRAGSRKQHFYTGAAAACGDTHPPEGALGDAPLAYPPQADLSGPPWGVCHRCRRIVESVEELAPLGGLEWTRGGSGSIDARSAGTNYISVTAKPHRKVRNGPIVSWHWSIYAAASTTGRERTTRATLAVTGSTEGPSATAAKEAALDALDVVRVCTSRLDDYFDGLGADEEGEE